MDDKVETVYREQASAEWSDFTSSRRQPVSPGECRPSSLKLRERLTSLIRNLKFTERLRSADDARSIATSDIETSAGVIGQKVGPALVDELCGLILSPPEEWSLDRALALIDAAKCDHLARLAILELACNELGAMWQCDDADFLTVSVASARLQMILRRRTSARRDLQPPGFAGSAIFTVAPGEDHIFAPCIIEEMFRTCGWTTCSRFPRQGEKAVFSPSDTRAKVVCFSWSTAALESEALEALVQIRQRFPVRETLLLAGGGASLEHEETLRQIGVDSICANSYTGLAIAERFVSSQLRTDSILRVSGGSG